MKISKKNILWLIHLVTMTIIYFLIVEISRDYFEGYSYYMNLYDNVDNDISFLQTASWYRSVAFFIIGTGLIVYVLCSLLAVYILKYTTKKFIIQFLFTSVVVEILLAIGTFGFGAFAGMNTVLVVIMTFLSMSFAIIYSILGYINNYDLYPNQK